MRVRIGPLLLSAFDSQPTADTTVQDFIDSQTSEEWSQIPLICE